MIFSGIMKSSLIDFPGNIACVLFVPGCNYNCFYCHNRTLIDGTHEIIMPKVIDDFLEKRKGLLDGVVITGGEPTLQKDLIEFMEKVKGLGYKLKLDTNGSSPEVIKKGIDKGLCDYFAVDYKAPSARYEEISGMDNAKTVLETINILLYENIDFEVRTTVIPQLDENDLIKMAKELPKLRRYVLNPYKRPDKFLPCDTVRINQKPYSQSDINDLMQKIKPYQPNVVA